MFTSLLQYTATYYSRDIIVYGDKEQAHKGGGVRSMKKKTIITREELLLLLAVLIGGSTAIRSYRLLSHFIWNLVSKRPSHVVYILPPFTSSRHLNPPSLV